MEPNIAQIYENGLFLFFPQCVCVRERETESKIALSNLTELSMFPQAIAAKAHTCASVPEHDYTV